MFTLRAVALASLAFLAPIRTTAAQGLALLQPPAGFDIEAVSEDGRYLTLRNGTVWEVDISDRATTGSWEAGNFVRMERISAPRGGYDWLLTKTENVDQSVAAKLVGRRMRYHGQ